MSDQPTGIFTLPASAYHDDPAAEPSLSASIASVLCAKTPLHAWTAHPKLNPDFKREEKANYDLGNCAHAILLEQREVEEFVEIIAAPDWRTNAAKDARDAARADGKLPMLAHTVAEVTAMLTAARRQLNAHHASPPLFEAGSGKAEQTLIWQEENGITCRSRVDWLRDDFQTIDDFKTTSTSADPERWTGRRLFEQGTDIQAAFYRRGVKALTGEEPELRYVIQETYPPFALSVISLGPDVLTVAEAKVEYAIRRWGECLEKGDWPGYPVEVAYAELPAWEEARWLAHETREEAAA